VDPFLILETTFVVDLEREAATDHPGPALAFLDAHPDQGLAITLTTAGELACGPDTSHKEAWEALVRRFRLLEPDRETAWRYGQLYRYLRTNGLLMGGNDLWIAATALTHDAPIVTRDVEHYRRVPELRVMSY
jgi:tRNA(fMet)-specific endonuclease VapC